MSEQAQLLNALNPEGEVRFGRLIIRGDSSVEKDGYRRDERYSYRVHPTLLPKLQRKIESFEVQKQQWERDLQHLVEKGFDEVETGYKQIQQMIAEQQRWQQAQDFRTWIGTTSNTGGLVYGSATSGKDPSP